MKIRTGSCISRWIIMAGLLMPGVGAWGARAAEIPAVRAEDFLNSIGACSAVSKRGENLSNTVEVVKHLGSVGSGQAMKAVSPWRICLNCTARPEFDSAMD